MCADNPAEVALLKVLFDEDVLWDSAEVVTGGEEHVRLFYGIDDPRGVLDADAERFLDEEVLSRPGRAGGQLRVQLRLRENDDAR